MNLRGFKLNKSIIRKLSGSLDDINFNIVKSGLDLLGSNKSPKFNKNEFSDLIRLFAQLDDDGLFDFMFNSDVVVFNYESDVTEMDIVLMGTIGDRSILIDIESKNNDSYSELADKVITQLKKRTEDFLPQLIKEDLYICIGYADNIFVESYTNIDGPVTKMGEAETYSLLRNKISNYRNTEDYLTNSAYIASITSIYRDIRQGCFKTFKDSDNLVHKLETLSDDVKAAIIYGHAGTGKSVIAFRLLKDLEESRILMLNSKLYNALGMNDLYYNNKATYNTETFIKNIVDGETISIVDESQRLSYESLKEIVRRSKITYLFGDDKQAWLPNQTTMPSKELKNKLEKDMSIQVHCSTLKKTRRYSDEVDKALSRLTSRQEHKEKIELPNNYIVSVFCDESEFINHYKKVDGIKKIYAPSNVLGNTLTIGEDTYCRAEYNYDTFSTTIQDARYFGTTYHALSFDIDHSFVYMTNTMVVNSGGRYYIFPSNFDFEEERLNLFLNELNILFTRGRKSLSIYIESVEGYLLMKKIIKGI